MPKHPRCETCTRHKARIRELTAIVRRLIAWESAMGGWEARVWQDARRVLKGRKSGGA